MIKEITISGFKAIQSVKVRMSDLTVFIGNNGSGKSSLIEALQTLQTALRSGLTDAFNERWLGMEYILNQQVEAVHKEYGSRSNASFPGGFQIELKGQLNQSTFLYSAHFNKHSNGDTYLVVAEHLIRDKKTVFKSEAREASVSADITIGPDEQITEQRTLSNSLILGDSKLNGDDPFARALNDYIIGWQFLALDPEKMYLPSKRDYSGSMIRLKSTGENLADFFSRMQDQPALAHEIVEKMSYVLPELTYIGRDEVAVQKLIYLFFKSKEMTSPIQSWLFSSGTLRILALLSVFNQKTPPSAIFIEEIENGLDPRTLNLMVEEIRNALGTTQVVVTTHSPYFLDLVDLKHIVVADRREGQTRFYRPDSDKRLDAWKKEFSPGRLYTMNKLDMP